MNRTLISLAIIKSHWEKNKADYIDNFVPLITSLAVEKKLDLINLESFQELFLKRYGLTIPINALITIFNRARKNGFFKKDQNQYYLNKEKAEQADFTIETNEVERKFNSVVNAIIDFAKNEYELSVTVDEIEVALLSFLKEHDLDILFAAKDKSVLPEVKSTKKLKYLISSFALSIVDENPQLFQTLIDISIGHALSGAILYSELNSFSGRLRNLNIYLDTPLILGLLGFNGDFKKTSIKELVSTLVEEQANVYILETTRGEVDHILSDCHSWLSKGNYDLEKSSRILRYCHRNGISSSDLEQKILALDDILSHLEINSTQVPSYAQNSEFVIDEKELKHTINNIYKGIIEDFDLSDYSKQATIDRDVKVLSGIYRFRKGVKPKTIKDSKDIFITSNTALAFASRVFETRNNGTSFTIPACLTDIFLGTVIWMQSPQKIEALNTKKFMADCFAATQPNTALIKKYLAEVEKMKSEERINNDEYYLLRTHKASLNLLEKKTMGDPEAFDGSSPEEILDSIMTSIKGKEEEKLNKEIEHHNKTKSLVADLQQTNDTLLKGINHKADFIAKVVSQLLFVIFILLTIGCLAINLLDEYFILSKKNKNILWGIISVLTILNLTNGFNILGFRNSVRHKLQKTISTWLTN